MIEKGQTLARIYLGKMGIGDMAVFKACLLSLGMLFGMLVPKNAKKVVAIVTATVFLATYIPLMWKLVRILLPKKED